MRCFGTCTHVFFSRFFRIHYNLFFLYVSINDRMCWPDDISNTEKRVRYSIESACIAERANGERELFSMVEIVSKWHEILLQYNNKNMHMIWISLSLSLSLALCYSFTHSCSHLYLKRMEIMRHCRSYFRCSIRCSRQSKCHYRDIHTNSRRSREWDGAKRKAPSGLVNKQYDMEKKRTNCTEGYWNSEFESVFDAYSNRNETGSVAEGGRKNGRCCTNSNWITTLFFFSSFDRCFQMLLTLHWLR